MITPRKSRVLEKIRAGKKALCFKSNLSCPRVAEIAGLTGFDALWICQEHVPTDHSTMENMIMAGKAHDMDPELFRKSIFFSKKREIALDFFANIDILY